MPISASIRLLAAAALIVPIASACAPNEPVATEPGTTPPVWTGSPSPTPTAGAGHGSGHGAAASGETLTANLALVDGTEVATATIDFTGDFATVTVETTTAGELTPGFHGLHIHQVGTCEGDFTSAGGHFQAEGHTGHPSSGDLSSLQVRSDGSAKLVTTTDAFTAEDLLAGSKTAIVIHEKADNFGNIPAEKYQQVNGTPGPDQQTLATGDAGGRVACGVFAAE
ncbi:superoxide dismutase[Cu-Zn] [Mycolicibacterium diernhoferi]|uniref:Superoxide dismutase n=1 Tax=Mycolicibacterium diernhoferi TaxID=1801 RepID=A0A1Q4H4C8_9MYCO|nr:superoxide dismutase family protein [Mycolicibacterium diernhoferi]OJZ61976.1 superoxide dismutase [Mycolicibacterium diernhoferi]OPE46537.1 superoxide dismutase [Mycolicibacterium diernhoferi]PEG51727.1 superoxide dismutase [Mycolicibacterium diernhoferi]QYL23488.1 superoxide dismutase family protein [Mycolicibacterium diernhoferi]